MTKKKLLLGLLSLIALYVPMLGAQTYHWDFRPPGLNDSTWFGIIGDHDSDDGHCDNTSETGVAFQDVDCGQWNDAPQAPIQDVNQDCGAGSCTVSATVRCSYMQPPVESPPPHAFYTFTCTGPATGPSGGVRSGNLGSGRKGVRCGTIECGCEVICPPGGHTLPNGAWAACYNQFFGFPSRINQVTWECQ